MNKFEGFDKDGLVLQAKCTTHHYRDLPGNGLGRSFDSVGLYEPVIIPRSASHNSAVWGFTELRIRERAEELKAAINYLELPPQNCHDEVRFQMWFSGLKQN